MDTSKDRLFAILGQSCHSILQLLPNQIIAGYPVADFAVVIDLPYKQDRFTVQRVSNLAYLKSTIDVVHFKPIEKQEAQNSRRKIAETEKFSLFHPRLAYQLNIFKAYLE